MKIAGTRRNADLADVVHTRLGADARMVKARAALWTLGGIGLAAFGIGAGVAVAVLAYARLNDRTTAAREIADILAATLKDARLTAQIDPASTVHLDPAATVGMAKGAEVAAKGVVSIDPASRLRLSGSGTADAARPTATQLAPDVAPQSKASVSTDYTVFKTVRFSRGSVVTGYKFAPDEEHPRSQYCYYSEGIDGEAVSIKIDLAEDGRFSRPKSRPGFDANAAATNCVWFDGRATSF